MCRLFPRIDKTNTSANQLQSIKDATTWFQQKYSPSWSGCESYPIHLEIIPLCQSTLEKGSILQIVWHLGASKSMS